MTVPSPAQDKIVIEVEEISFEADDYTTQPYSSSNTDCSNFTYSIIAVETKVISPL